MWYSHKNRHADQLKRIEDPDLSPPTFFLMKRQKCILEKENTASSTNDACQMGCRAMRLCWYSSPCTVLNSNAVKDLRSLDTLRRIWEKKARECKRYAWTYRGRDFLNKTLMTHSTTDEGGWVKWKSSSTAKDIITQVKRHSTEWKKKLYQLYMTVLVAWMYKYTKKYTQK